MFRIVCALALLMAVATVTAVPVNDMPADEVLPGSSEVDADLADLVSYEHMEKEASKAKESEEDDEADALRKHVEANPEDASLDEEAAPASKKDAEDSFVQTDAKVKVIPSTNEEAVAVGAAIKRSIESDVAMHSQLDADMKHLAQDIAMSRDLRAMENKFRQKAANAFGDNANEETALSEKSEISEQVTACERELANCREQYGCPNTSASDCKFASEFKDCAARAALSCP